MKKEATEQAGGHGFSRFSVCRVQIACLIAAVFLSVFHCSIAISCSWMRPSSFVWNPLHYTLFPYALIQFGLLLFFWFTTFALAARSNFFCVFVLFPLLLNEIVHEYSKSRYGVAYETIMQAAFASTFAQVRPYLRFGVICLLSALLLFLAVMLYGQRRYWKNRKRHLLRWSALWGGSILLPLTLCWGHKIGLPDARYDMCLYLQGSYHISCYGGEKLKSTRDYYRDEIYRDFVDRAPAKDAYIPFLDIIDWVETGLNYYCPPSLENCASCPSSIDCKSSQLTVVLYVAESWRHDHTPWGGYHRNTVPCFSQTYMQNVIAFPNVMSFDTSTMPSLYGILTNADETHRKATHNSFLSLFKKHGFHSTIAELTADFAPWHTTPLFCNLLRGCNDEVLTLQTEDDFRKLGREIAASGRKNVLLVDDGTGHHPYEGTKGVWGESLEDKYDECRLAMDRNLCALLHEIQGLPAILLFVSDHGESFGDEGRYVHGGPLSATEQRHVAAFVYYTDAYANLYPEVIENLRRNREAFSSHDNVFHTMPSLGGIHSSVQNEELDMTKHQSTP